MSFYKSTYFNLLNFFREIDHRMSMKDWMKESSDLDEMIKFMGLPVDSEQMYVNGYSSPWDVHQKHELWKVKK